jgi:hypothetical protein
VPKVPLCDLMHLCANQRQEMFERGRVAVMPARQKSRDVAM